MSGDLPCPLCDALACGLDPTEALVFGFGLGRAFPDTPLEIGVCKAHRTIVTLARMSVADKMPHAHNKRGT